MSQDTGRPAESFEDALTELQNIVKKMESGELSLDQSLKAFEQGVALSRKCSEQLVVAEQKVEQLLSVGQSGDSRFGPLGSG